MKNVHSHTVVKKQQGAALIVAMVILVLLTIIGVQGMETSSLENRMVGNMRDKTLAFEAAEAAMLEAEVFLKTITNVGSFDGDGGDGYYDNTLLDIWNEVDWEGAGGNPNLSITAIVSIPDVYQPPQYVIQFIGKSEEDDVSGGYGVGGGYDSGQSQGDVGIFRVTARGTGSTEKAVVVLQSVFGQRVN